MSKESTRYVHEKYHKTTKESQKIIKSNNFTYRHLIKIIKGYLPSCKNILDIGCGAGTLSFYFAQMGIHVTGVDISQKAVTSCKNSAMNLGLKNTLFLRSDFPNKISLHKKYDLIIFTEVIEHLANDELAIKKIHNLLTKKGVLILSTPSINAPLYKLGLTVKFDKEVGHIRRYKLDQLESLIRRNNFKILQTKKTEGILRNFLFINPYAGKLIRLINHFGTNYVTFLDNITLRLFGESNFIIVAKKIPK